VARHWSPLILLFLLLVPFAPAKDKKEILPGYVLEAKTVLVVIDPNAGISSSNPNENRTAQEDVEKALMNWGRFSPALDATNADLVISVRRGHGKAVTNTIGSVPNDRPVIMEPIDSGIRIGAQHGTPPSVTADSPPPRPHPRPRLDQRRTRSSCIAERSSILSIALRFGASSHKTLSVRPLFPPLLIFRK